MHRTHRIGMGLLALSLFASGCYGPFNLTRRLYRWNGQASNEKWGKEIVFLILALTPVYSLTTLADAIVFNSMEFWTGNNPVDPPSGRSALPQPTTKRITRGDDAAVLTYAQTTAGPPLIIVQFHRGQPAGRLTLAQGEGRAVSSDAEGNVLLTAQATPEGGVAVRNAQGQQVASYSADQVEQFYRSATQ